ncbi:MAG: FtsX-like permease family protein, partial [Planctomycetota bacterium]
AQVLPTIFLGIAAAIIIITLSRLVKNQRIEIGTLMALGYSKLRIALHYISFAVVVGTIGSFIGISLGYYFAGLVAEIYKDFYSFPLLVVEVQPEVILYSFGFGLIFAVAGGLIAVRNVLNLTPAVALRAKPPSKGKRIFLERIGFIWQILSYRWKMIVRNLWRHKIRAFLAVFGIALSTMILLFGFVVSDAMDYLMEHQFRRVQCEDVKVYFSSERDVSSARELAHLREVKRAEPVLEVPVEIRNGWRKKSLSITGIEKNGELHRVLDVGSRRVRVPEKGVLLEKRIADFLGVKVGDTVKVKPLIGRKKEKELIVSSVTEGYLGLSAYMEIGTLSWLLGERKVATSALLSIDKEQAHSLEKKLKDYPAVASIQPKESLIKAFDDTLKSAMYIAVIQLLIFAGLISFSIIFTMTSVSIAERERELASLRVIGLSVSEVAAIVFNENFFLALTGIVIGLPLSAAAGRMIIGFYDTDMYRFPSAIEPESYFITAVVAFIFVMLSNWFCYKKISKLDMVGVLKTRE